MSEIPRQISFARGFFFDSSLFEKTPFSSLSKSPNPLGHKGLGGFSFVTFVTV